MSLKPCLALSGCGPSWNTSLYPGTPYTHPHPRMLPAILHDSLRGICNHSWGAQSERDCCGDKTGNEPCLQCQHQDRVSSDLLSPNQCLQRCRLGNVPDHAWKTIPSIRSIAWKGRWTARLGRCFLELACRKYPGHMPSLCIAWNQPTDNSRHYECSYSNRYAHGGFLKYGYPQIIIHL